MPAQPGIFPLHVPTPRPPPHTERSPVRPAAVFSLTWEEARAPDGHRLWVLTAKLNIKEGPETPLSSLTLRRKEWRKWCCVCTVWGSKDPGVSTETLQVPAGLVISAPPLSALHLAFL